MTKHPPVALLLFRLIYFLCNLKKYMKRFCKKKNILLVLVRPGSRDWLVCEQQRHDIRLHSDPSLFIFLSHELWRNSDWQVQISLCLWSAVIVQMNVCMHVPSTPHAARSISSNWSVSVGGRIREASAAPRSHSMHRKCEWCRLCPGPCVRLQGVFAISDIDNRDRDQYESFSGSHDQTKLT